jgi:hypothetical protein
MDDRWCNILVCFGHWDCRLYVVTSNRNLIQERSEPLLHEILQNFGNLVGTRPTFADFVKVFCHQLLLDDGMLQLLLGDPGATASLHGDEQVDGARRKCNLDKGYWAEPQAKEVLPRLEDFHDAICSTLAKLGSEMPVNNYS